MVDLLLILSNPPKAFRAWAEGPAERSSDDDEDPDEPIRDDWRLQRRLTAAERSCLLERYQAGERAFDLASGYGVHRQTVARIVTEAGVRRPRLMTESERAEAIQLYQGGWTCQAIGLELGRSRDAVRRALHVARVKMRPFWESRQLGPGTQ